MNLKFPLQLFVYILHLNYFLKKESSWELSVEVQCFLMCLEFIYRLLNCLISCSDPSFNQQFIDTVIAHVEVVFEHCEETIDKLLKAFVKFRAKFQYPC